MIIDNFGRKLNEEEKGIMTMNFPHLKNNEIEKMKYLGAGGEFIHSKDGKDHPLCNKYECMDEELVVEVYNTKTNSYIGLVTAGVRDYICKSSDIRCVDMYRYYATYNCIGWALGVSKWLDPGEITEFIEDGLTTKEAIKQFIERSIKKYPNSHTANFEKIIDKITVDFSHTGLTKNNTIAFYFKGTECLHGSRYLETINEKPIDQWTSKLGKSILISHEENSLLSKDSMYGNMTYIVGIIAKEDHMHDEL